MEVYPELAKNESEGGYGTGNGVTRKSILHCLFKMLDKDQDMLLTRRELNRFIKELAGYWHLTLKPMWRKEVR